MFKSLKNMFSPFSAMSPHSHLLPLSSELELGGKLKTDIHSHLIPAVDDGVKSVDEAIELLKKYAELGYEKVITTPHIMQDRYNNTHSKIQNGLNILKGELLKRSISIEIEAAAEYYMDEQFEKLLYKRDLLTFGDNYVLFEISFTQEPKNLLNIILEMQVAGYKPVLAHPERYSFMHNKRDIYLSLKEHDVFFQIDMLCFTNYHSFDVQRTVLWLCNNGMIDFIGSDAHRIGHLDLIENLKSTSILKAVYDKNHLLNSTL